MDFPRPFLGRIIRRLENKTIMRNHFFFSLLFLIFSWECFADEITFITLKGYLDKEHLAGPQKALEENLQKQLVIEINSSGGDLFEVFELAKKIYEKKIESNPRIVVYIEDSALGPAAIIPFLADELYISLFVSWGDIPFGTENVLPVNILRNRVISLISPGHPQADLLQLLAAAMTDKSVRIVNDRGWRLAVGDKDAGLPSISTGGEPLVVNQNQLRELGLVKEVLSEPKFASLFKISQKQEEQFQAPPSSTQTLAIPEKVLEKELREHIKFDPQRPTTVGLITIEDRDNGINQSTWLYVKNALDYYKQKKPSFIILQLNTPGGEVFSAQKIATALKEMDTQYNIPVVAFINNWAISAGAMLAYSSRFIAVVKDGSMGAAEPLTIQNGKAEVASEKVNSALRADFANHASFFGRNPSIAEAMVDKDTILVLRHGKIIKLNSMDEIHKTGPDPDIIINAKGKLLTLNSEQLIKYGVADILLPSNTLTPITDKEKGEGKWPAEKMMLFTHPFFAQMKSAVIDEYRMDWKTQFFVFLANPVISSLLFLGLMVGFYMELSTPGFGLAGTVAVTCLFLIILSSFALEIANWLELILLLTGLAIIIVELFVLPTFGLLGFIGIIFFLAGLFGMMLPGIGSVSFEVDTHTLNAAGEAFFTRLAWLCGTLVLAFFICLLLSRYVTPTLAGLSRFVLKGHEQEGYLAVDDKASLPHPGDRGEVIATLRPAGKVLINNQIYDAISMGAFIEKGEKIVVDHLDGSSLVVIKTG